MDEPMGRCEGIVVSERQNISANNKAMRSHFAALRRLARHYIEAMQAMLLRPLTRLNGRCAWRGLIWIALAGVSAFSQAAEPNNVPNSALDPALDQQVRQLTLGALRTGTVGVKRVEVSVGTLDPRLRLAPCQRVEPYLPAGVRLWGKTRVGLRCTQGATAWNVFLPVTVKAYGPALVAAAALPAGSVLAATDFAQAEVDLADDPSVALNNGTAVVGRTLLHALLPGQSLRQANLKPRQWFAAGETVQVQAQGAGFSVASEGQALTPGIEGQVARVRTEGGRVLVGLPVAENRMELSL